jgi:hypothetical protein
VRVGFADPVAPGAPAPLAQFEADAVTAITGGAWTRFGASTNVVLRGTASSSAAAEALTPRAELRPTAAGFANTCGQVAAGSSWSGAAVPAPTAGVGVALSLPVTGLANGSSHAWRTCAVGAWGFPGAWSARGGAPDFRIDVTDPVNPTTIADLSTTMVDSDWSSSATALSASFDAGSDAASGIASYDACFSSSSATCMAVAPIVSGNTTRVVSATASPALGNGALAHTCVRSRDAAGNVAAAWACSDGFRVDVTAPTAPASRSDGAAGDVASQVGATVSANWSAGADTAPGVVGGYDWCLNDAASCATPLDGGSTSALGVSAPATGMTAGSTYFFCVRSTDRARNASAYACTDGFTWNPVIVTSINPASILAGASGTVVTLTGSGFTPGMTVSISGAGVTAVGSSYSSPNSFTVTLDVAVSAATTARDIVTTTTAGTRLNPSLLTIVAPSLSISTPASAVPMGTLLPGVDATASFTVGVSTNAPTGYRMSAKDEDDDWGMACPCAAQLPDWTGSDAEPSTWAPGLGGATGYAGFTVRDVAGSTTNRLTKWGTANAAGWPADDYGNNRYAGLDLTSSTLVHESTGPAPADTITGTWRVTPGNTTTSGTYEATLTFTAVVRP